MPIIAISCQLVNIFNGTHQHIIFKWFFTYLQCFFTLVCSVCWLDIQWQFRSRFCNFYSSFFIERDNENDIKAWVKIWNNFFCSVAGVFKCWNYWNFFQWSKYFGYDNSTRQKPKKKSKRKCTFGTLLQNISNMWKPVSTSWNSGWGIYFFIFYSDFVARR